MYLEKKIILFFALLIISEGTFSQQPPTGPDSTNLYKNIETYSKRNKFNTFVYSLIFKKPAILAPKKKKTKSKKKTYSKLIQKPYSTFEGKIIRHINIVTFDPFGYSISDTSIYPKILLPRIGNKMHIKSSSYAIRNLLLIKQNEPFDSLLVKESERLIRSRNYVRDVSFFVIATAKNSDSVDIFIREYDTWSIIPKIESSTTSSTFIITDKNFLGLGHELKNAYTRNYSAGTNANSTNYLIPNIKNTFISTNLHYAIDENKYYNKSFTIDRPFYSPFAKWAAGVNFSQQFRKDSVRAYHSPYIFQRFKFNSQDYWAGNAIQLFKGNTEDNRTTNFITTARFYRIRYREKPTALIDSVNQFADENFYLASAGVSTRKYVQDKYIFKFGVPEDVPIGKIYNLVGGYQVRNNDSRIYLSARVSFGNYYPWGYISSNYEFGTFFKAGQIEQGVLTVGVNYFTGLYKIGTWKLRQFVKPEIIFGFNRLSYDSLTLNDGYGIDGFNSTGLSGTNRLIVTWQTQLYSPWRLLGFHFGPYLICALGMLGNTDNILDASTVYSQIGIGVLVKNENLVLNTFQFSLSFYPSIPGRGFNLFKTNTFKSSDFGFRDFEINKPQPVVFE